MTNTSILNAFKRFWQHIVAALSNKSDIGHTHDDIYCTEAEIDEKVAEINTTIADSYVHYNDTLITTNPHAGHKLYISKIDNLLYCGDKRWTVTMDIYSKTDDSLVNSITNCSKIFNGSYESDVINIPAGHYGILTIDCPYYISTYQYGTFYMSFYYTSYPDSITWREYCNYNAHGIGWKDMGSFEEDEASVSNGKIYRGHNPWHNINKYEFTIVASDSKDAGLTQLEFKSDRPAPRNNPFVGKYTAETLYYELTAPSFKGALNGNANTATKATQDASGNVITSTYETKTNASSKLTEAKAYADTIKNDLLNGAGEAYDTLKELGDLIDENVNAIEALETVASGKQNKITGVSG